MCLAAAIGSLPAFACRYRGLDESQLRCARHFSLAEMTSLVLHHLGHIKLPNRFLPIVLIRNGGHPPKVNRLIKLMAMDDTEPILILE